MSGMDELKLAAASVDVEKLRECIVELTRQKDHLRLIIELTRATLQDSNLEQDDKLNLAQRFLAGEVVV